MLSPGFLSDFKRRTEATWAHATIDPKIYGFQFQSGTHWLPGLSEQQIRDYEVAVDAKFPDDFREILGFMNGTDKPTLNIYGGECAPKESVGVYSYPRDLDHVKQRISEVATNRAGIQEELLDYDFSLSPKARLVPIFAHRYVVCDPDRATSVVLSICGTDAVVYGDTLQLYLEKEFCP
jgi:hypothetical protein